MEQQHRTRASGSGVIAQRISRSRVTVSNRFDTTKAEAWGASSKREVSGRGLRKYNGFILWKSFRTIIRGCGPSDDGTVRQVRCA
jgi:hypothetical protein